MGGRPSVPPLRRYREGPILLVGAGPRPARPGFAPGALVRQTQAQTWNRTKNKFCKLRAQWPGLNGRRPLRFCAPEGFCQPQGVTLVREVRGSGQYGHGVAILSRPPVPCALLSPPGGPAAGLARLCMLLAGSDPIRDVIAFPQVQNASEPMTNCPDFVDDKQLDELSLAVTRREEASDEE